MPNTKVVNQEQAYDIITELFERETKKEGVYLFYSGKDKCGNNVLVILGPSDDSIVTIF